MRIIRCALESLQKEKERHVVIQIEGIGLAGRNYPKGILARLYQHLPSTSLANIKIRD
jgi:hypothetical protein